MRATESVLMTCVGCAFLALLLPCLDAQADAIDDLAAGAWYEVPNSQMASVFPAPRPPGHPSNVVAAWGGATLDTVGERLLVWGGGHADYSGNEVYAFSLRTLTWERLTDPSVTDMLNNETYADGNPVSRHTYSGLAYVPSVDAMYARGGSRWHIGNGTSATWRFMLATRSWQRMRDVPAWDFFGDATAHDPVSGHTFYRGNRNLWEYDPAADSYTARASSGGGWWESNISCAIDSVGREVLYAGERISRFNITSSAFEDGLVFAGNDLVLSHGAPGLAFDPMLSRFVAWSGGTTIYSLDRAGGAWVSHAATGGPSPGNPTASGGTFGRFRYVPSRNVYVLLNSAEANVFIYRMSGGPGVSPPRAPQSLRVN